jgi:hypothetical protein
MPVQQLGRQACMAWEKAGIVDDGIPVPAFQRVKLAIPVAASVASPLAVCDESRYY